MRNPDHPLPTRTKLVATLGPATAAEAALERVLAAGVDVCRLNFSHGTLDDHGRNLARIRAWSKANDRPVAVLGDLCGPKIRLNRVPGDGIALVDGATVRIVRGTEDCTPDRLSTSFEEMIDQAGVGHRLYIDDGLVRLQITKKEPDALVCTVAVGGKITSKKGINLPDTRLSTPALTEKDIGDARWAMQAGLDYLALSFVRQPTDLRQLRELTRTAGSRIGIIVKVEKVEALEHLDELVGESDGVMVARGDLGVELDVWQVPLIQKAITARARDCGKPVIVATQMLQSMIAAPTPTRAEVSDVANAIVDGADAVMLSAETASGTFPVESVRIMAQVATATEAFVASTFRDVPATSLSASGRVTSAIAEGAARAASLLGARLIAAWTATGETVRLLAMHRLPVPIVALTSDPEVLRRLNLIYSVTPLLAPPQRNPVEMLKTVDERVLACGLATAGQLIVVVTSTRPQTPGATDTMLVHRLGT